MTDITDITVATVVPTFTVGTGAHVVSGVKHVVGIPAVAGI